MTQNTCAATDDRPSREMGMCKHSLAYRKSHPLSGLRTPTEIPKQLWLSVVGRR